MMEFIDTFGRQTIIEVLPSYWNKRASIVFKKERQTIYESISLEDLKKLSNFITCAIANLERNDVEEI